MSDIKRSAAIEQMKQEINAELQLGLMEVHSRNGDILILKQLRDGFRSEYEEELENIKPLMKSNRLRRVMILRNIYKIQKDPEETKEEKHE